MSNKYMFMVMGAIMAVVWFFVGTMAFFAPTEGGLGGMSTIWWFAMIVAVGLGAGSTGGDDMISIMVEGIKGYVPTMIMLAIFGLVGGLVYVLAVERGTPVPMDMARDVLTFVVGGLLVNMMMSYMKKANA